MIVVGILQFAILLVGLARAKGLAIILGPEGVGVVGTIDQLVITVAQIGALGIPYTAMKFMSSAHSRSNAEYLKTFAAFGRVMLFLAALSGLVIVGVFAFFPDMLDPGAGLHRQTLLLAILSVPALMLTFFLPQVLAAAQRSRRAAVFNLISLAVLTGAALWGASVGGVYGLYIGTTITCAVFILIMLIVFHRVFGLSVFRKGVSVKQELARKPNVLRTAFMSYTSLVAYAVCMLIVRYTVLDQLGDTETGYLQAALSIALSVGSILAAMIVLQLAPALNRDTPALEKFSQANSFAARVALLIIIGSVPIALFPNLVLSVLYAPAFVPAVSALILCLVWQGLFQLMTIYQQLLIGLNHLRFTAVSTVVGLLVSGLLVYVLIARFGILAAPLALIAGTSLTVTLNIARLVQSEKMPLPWAVLARFALAAGLVLGASLLFSGQAEFSLNWFSYRAVFALSVAAFVWFLISPQDRLLVTAGIRRVLRL